MPAALFRWLLQLHMDVPTAGRFYAEGLDFTVNSSLFKLSLMQNPKDHAVQNGNSSLLSFTVPDINQTVTKLLPFDVFDGHMLGLYEPA
ncbi:hypothetical protein D8674_040680 [Pyrus ussuriensis x Pyrus communis]|uniref:Uncharacterized protein n=1 Tax=Pyrus ussuriensis x Pyrus communis TaxID=2448454 RepID=A0A5N5H733_9ROSA|nr:hypothetical protein D8674_039234 [Pyrus ussuriensis x Pyrus communis]KAB2623785.1 hypothetical protein D8674_040680 [Pyrus ussuriensis x Pyrus communis]